MASLTPRLDKLDKNYIINGNFDYWQRGISFIGAGAGYTADRMFTTYSTGTSDYARSTDVPDANSTYSLQIINTAGTNPQINHRIESIFAKDLASKDITIKVKVKAVDATGVPIKIQLGVPDVTDTYGSGTVFSTLTISSNPTANTWITYSATVSVPATAVRGLVVNVLRDSSGVPTTTTTRFSQLQLILGDNVDPDYCYAARNMVDEFRLCQRYYEKSYDPTTNPGSAVGSGLLTGIRGSGGFVMSTRYAAPKRVIPTVVIYSPVTGNSGVLRNDNLGADEAATVLQNGISGLSLAGTTVTINTSLSAHWTASAEL